MRTAITLGRCTNFVSLIHFFPPQISLSRLFFRKKKSGFLPLVRLHMTFIRLPGPTPQKDDKGYS